MRKKGLNDFKIGQKVRCIRAGGLFAPAFVEDGKVYTVSRASGIGTIMLEEVRQDKWYNENRFEEYNDYLPEELFNV